MVRGNETAFSGGKLNLVQLIAAVAVIYSHSYPLAAGSGAGAPILEWGVNWGHLAVDVFLFLSGFMVVESFTCNGWRSRIFDLIRYAIKRFLRIGPVIWFATLCSFYVLGPALSSLSVHDYFAKAYEGHFFANLQLYNVTYHLPGVFENNHNHAINGSLWVIPWQMWCYTLLACFGLFGLHRRKFLMLVFCTWVWGAYLGQNWVFGKARFMDRMVVDGFRLVAFFVLGWTWRLWVDDIRRNGRLAICLLMPLWLFLRTPAYDLSIGLFVGYALVTFIYSGSCSWLDRVPRISFGVFVLAFPVQQILVDLNGGTMNKLHNFVISTSIVIPLAVLVMYIVERPAARVRNIMLRSVDALQNRCEIVFRRVRSA